MFRYGIVITDDNIQTQTHTDEELANIKIWSLSQDVCTKVVGMPVCDGIVFGTRLRRIPALKGIESGVLCVWNRRNHQKYMLIEVTPSKDLIINNFVGSDWSESSVPAGRHAT